MDSDIEEGIHDTGKWLAMHADMEHAAEDVPTIEYRCVDGRWVVGGVVAVESIELALELVAA